MAHPIIAQVLENCSYSDFARFVGKYRHDLLNAEGNVQLYCTVISRFLERLPDAAPLRSGGVQNARDTAHELVEFSHRLVAEIREILWFPKDSEIPELTDEQQARFAAVQERWQPYDGQTWDALLAALADHVQGRVKEFEALLAHLDQTLRGLAEDAADDELLPDLVDNIMSECVAAQDMLAHFEAFVDADRLEYDPDGNQWHVAEH